MQLSAIELPVAFYGISSSYGNNYLYISINYDLCIADKCQIECANLDCQRIFIIPDGNYTANDLIDTINFLISPPNTETPDDLFKFIQFSIDINENGSGSRRVSVGPIINDICNINTITLDFTKNISGQPDTANIFTKIGWNLGFTKPVYKGDTFYTAETIIEPSTKYIYLAIDDFNNSSNNHFISAFNQSIMNTDILARISVKGTMINLISENDYNLVTEPRQYFGPVDIQRLRVRLFDEFGRVLSMNSSNYSFCLSLKVLYDL
jgi:hypothetical protein